MPNHCDNDLYVRGKLAIIKEFQLFGATEQELLDADRFIPYPEKFKELDALYKEQKREKDGFNSGGYEWCCENWGTKWGLYDCALLYEKKSSVKYRFLSAWSPPLPVIKKMSELFPELRFTLRYYECGAGFKGVFECKGGAVKADTGGPYRGDRGG
jgi:hypothetical protein